MQKSKTHIKIVGASEGTILGVAGDNYRIVVSSEQTEGSYSVFDMLVPPGGGPQPHAHPQMQEYFYVLEGELVFKTTAGHSIVGKGGFVHIPFGGDIHCFRNDSDKIARVLCTVMPAGLENVFAILGQPVGAGEFLPPPKMTAELEGKLKGLNEKFNQIIYPPDYLD